MLFIFYGIKSNLNILLTFNSDMLGSGMSVLATHGAYQDREDLSNSVQAQLHLSLDRLSENYDPDDIKRLQDKKMSSRQWKQSGDYKDNGLQ